MLLLRRRAGEDRCLVLILRCRLTKGANDDVCASILVSRRF